MDNNDKPTAPASQLTTQPRRLSWQVVMAMLGVLFAAVGLGGGLWLLSAAAGNLELARYGYGFMTMTGLLTLVPAASAIRGRKAWKVTAIVLFIAGLALACYGLYGLALAGTFGMNIRDSM